MKDFDYLSLTGQQLLTFVTLHEVGTVTATAEKLGTTQSAVSHSLQKLREIFGDELFVRAGRSVAPTLKSQELYLEVKTILRRLDELTHTQAFDPKTANLDYKISANDYQSNLWLPHFYRHVSGQVQSLSMEISPSKKTNIELLRSNQVDLVISNIAPNHNDIMATRLFTDISHCFYDESVRDAPKNLYELQQGKFVSLTFMKGITLSGQYNQILEMLDNNTVIRVSNFASVPSFVVGTDLLAVMPSKLKDTLGYHQLAHAPLPYQATEVTMYMLWHKRYHHDAKHKWFREQVLSFRGKLG